MRLVCGEGKLMFNGRLTPGGGKDGAKAIKKEPRMRRLSGV